MTQGLFSLSIKEPKGFLGKKNPPYSYCSLGPHYQSVFSSLMAVPRSPIGPGGPADPGGPGSPDVPETRKKPLKHL